MGQGGFVPSIDLFGPEEFGSLLLIFLVRNRAGFPGLLQINQLLANRRGNHLLANDGMLVGISRIAS